MNARRATPPRTLAFVLSKLLSGSIREGALDDFGEKYAGIAEERGRGAAVAWYAGQILCLVPAALMESLFWSVVMIQNYAKVAVRNIRKHKAYSLINVAGLALGLTVSLFIFLWIRDELSFDRFHVGFQDIYRLTEDQRSADGSIFPVAVTPELLGPGLKADFPEVLEFARIRPLGRNLISHGDRQFYEGGIVFVDPAFLEIFSFPLVKGDPATALANPDSMVITEGTARRYFGNEDPMGRTLRLANAFDFRVTGVAHDAPANSHLRFDILGNFDVVLKTFGFGGGWWNNNFYTYVRLTPNADLGKLSPLVHEYLTRIEPRTRTRIRLQPLRDIHLRSSYAIDTYGATQDRSKDITIFATVAFLVLLIACINYMNLATARAGFRSKEVGLRKVVGAGRSEIMRQFFGESLLFAVVSALFAAGLARLCLPLFNNLSAKTLTPSALAALPVLLFLGGAALLAGVLSGVYPALFLSAFRPVSIFRGEPLTGTRSALFRKSLVVLQFGMSIVFIAGTLVISAQLRYMNTKNLGYDRESVVYFRLRGDLGRNYNAFKNELSNNPAIMGVTSSSDIPTYTVHSTGAFAWEGREPEQRILIHQFSVDYDYFEILGMEMAEGRSFSREFPSDEGAFIVNETAVRLMGYEDPLGKTLTLYDRRGPIVGVVRDFNFKSLHTSVEPLVLRIEPARNAYVLVKLVPGKIAEGLETIRRLHEAHNPGNPLEYDFLDESLGGLYGADRRFGAIIRVFTGLAIFVSCLGLFGLASFLIERRTREIGIRKILGADTGRIVILLSKDFLKWVAAANLIAIPVAYYAMGRWLESYAYRTGISAWVFVGAGCLALGIALLTISAHSFRAAGANPAESLRYE